MSGDPASLIVQGLFCDDSVELGAGLGIWFTGEAVLEAEGEPADLDAEHAIENAITDKVTTKNAFMILIMPWGASRRYSESSCR